MPDSIHGELYGHILPSLIDGFRGRVGPALFLAEQAHCLYRPATAVSAHYVQGEKIVATLPRVNRIPASLCAAEFPEFENWSGTLRASLCS
jgi:hypothetical protein